MLKIILSLDPFAPVLFILIHIISDCDKSYNFIPVPNFIPVQDYSNMFKIHHTKNVSNCSLKFLVVRLHSLVYSQ